MSMLSNLLARLDRQPSLMSGMMERVNVDIAAVGREPLGLQLERAYRACIFCGHGEACRAWQETAGKGAEAPSFCANRQFFAAHSSAS